MQKIKIFIITSMFQISKYINLIRPAEIAKHTRAAEPIISRARFVMDEFIHHLTPLNMMKSSTFSTSTTRKVGKPLQAIRHFVGTHISSKG